MPMAGLVMMRCVAKSVLSASFDGRVCRTRLKERAAQQTGNPVVHMHGTELQGLGLPEQEDWRGCGQTSAPRGG